MSFKNVYVEKYSMQNVTSVGRRLVFEKKKHFDANTEKALPEIVRIKLPGDNNF